jgi:hypothetical protein
LVGIECVVYSECSRGLVWRIHLRMLSLLNGAEGFIVV